MTRGIQEGLARTAGLGIARERGRAEMTGTELAGLIGKSESAIRALETGQRGTSLKMLEEVAEALGIDAAALILPEDEPAVAAARVLLLVAGFNCFKLLFEEYQKLPIDEEAKLDVGGKGGIEKALKLTRELVKLAGDSTPELVAEVMAELAAA